jgi:hypothetical protein
MNRRNFLAAGIAFAGQHKLLRSMGTLPVAVKSNGPAGPPQNLLSNTYTPSFLASKLVPPGEWHPYPRWNERGPWDAVPSDLRAAIIEQAEIDQKAGWPLLLATGALDFQRTGDRTRAC